jgi:rod shape-determining protein MreB
MAAAIGIGLPVDEPVGSMVIDIGGGTTEIAVIALSGIVRQVSIKVAGNEMDEAIQRFMKRNYNLSVGPRTAEAIKCQLGSAYPLEQEIETPVKGLDLVAAIPRTIMVNSTEIREALNDTVSMIIDALRQSLEQTPPELAADILDRGIIMTGGGALLRGLARRFMEETSLPFYVAEDPLTCVVRGTGKVLEDVDGHRKMLF